MALGFKYLGGILSGDLVDSVVVLSCFGNCRGGDEFWNASGRDVRLIGMYIKGGTRGNLKTVCQIFWLNCVKQYPLRRQDVRMGFYAYGNFCYRMGAGLE